VAQGLGVLETGKFMSSLQQSSTPRSRIGTSALTIRIAGFLFVFLATVMLVLAGKHWLLPLSGIVVLGALVFLRHPHWLFILIIALIPYWGLRSFDNINVQWPMGMALILILLLSSMTQKRLPEALASSLWYPFILLLFIFVLASWRSAFPETAWQETLFLLSAYMYIALGFVYIDRDLYSSILPWTIMLTVGFGSAVVLVDYFFDLPFVPLDPRGFGLTNNPNNVAKMAIVTLPLIIHYLMNKRSPKRGILYALLILNVAAVFISQSRAGFLILLLTVIMLVYQHRSRFRPIRTGQIIASLAVVLTVAFVTVPQSFWARQTSLLEFEDTSLKRRVAYLHIAWQSFLDAPFLGSGPGTFRDLYAWSPRAAEFISESERDRRHKLRDTKMRRTAHNGYLEILVGSGLFGLAVFLSILVMTNRRFGRAIAHFNASGQGKMASLTAAYRISYFIFLLYFLVGSGIFHKYFLLMIAISEVSLRLSRSAR
jgi:O-antigen ligase